VAPLEEGRKKLIVIKDIGSICPKRRFIIIIIINNNDHGAGVNIVMII
jgi:hypothetical protein